MVVVRGAVDGFEVEFGVFGVGVVGVEEVGGGYGVEFEEVAL